MTWWIAFLNNIAVSLFGIILAASFCDVPNQPKKRRMFWCGILFILLAQGLVYAHWDTGFLKKIYPLIVHLPLLCVLYLLTRRMLWSFVSVLTAYLCCQLRRWIALMVVFMLPYRLITLELVELVITLPLLLLLIRCVSPSISRLSGYPVRSQCQFGAIPFLYYVFDYLTTVYTDLLSGGSAVVVEFMPFVCCASYIIFLVHDCAEQRRQMQMQQVQDSMGAQLSQAVREIDALRQSQTLTRQYRHDLRHHLQYLSNCIENGKDQEAQDYIFTIFQEIEKQKVKQYCENEAANLILSAFVSRAEKSGVQMQINGSLPAFIRISNNDLCVLISNALENALHACQPIVDEGGSAVIDIRFYEKEDRFFLQVKNPYCGDITFEKGIPVSNQPGHGIGVRSICAVTERYGGVCSFLTRGNEFILRLSA